LDLLFQPAPQRTGTEQVGFTTYFASSPAIEGRMSLLICVHNEDGSTNEQEVNMGNGKKDPDGYVYDAEVGIEALIASATVNCDIFDDEERSWDRWPAELYDQQVNPQITTEDGYYAFLVPPGLYRVRAQADGYVTHISPDLRVINEAIHYNVPMERPRIYVPMLLR